MKKLLPFILLFFTSSCVFAQDIIIKTNGEEIEAKIIEINTSEIKYKKHSLPDGPVFVILKTEVFMVKYSNGEKELINKKEENKNNTKDSANKVTSVRVTYSSLAKKNKDMPEFWGALKLNPLLSFVGEYPLFFEKVLKKKTSVELGLGPTYPTLLMTGFFDGVFFDFDDRLKRIGYSVSANYRLYPEIVFEEFYFGIDFRYKSYLTKLISCGGTPVQNKNEDFNYLDFKILIGYTTDMGSSALFEFFIAFGLRNSKWNYYYCDAYFIENIVNNNTAPTVSFGVKLGLGLERETTTK